MANTPKRLARPLADRVAGLDPPPTPPDESQPIPPNVINAAIDALDRGETHYTDRPGIPEFRGWVAEHLRERYGLGVDQTEVTITCGSTEARYVTMTLLTEPGSAVLCPGDPTPIRGALHLLGARVVDAVEPDISVLYLTPDIYRETVEQLLRQAEDADWWIVWDLSFARRSTDFHPARIESLAERVVTIDSLSQRMPGWRLGWMAGSEAALRLRAGKQAITICTTAVSQWAGLEWVSSRMR